eukprot:TRINITY_DN6354_c0_g1_i1.p1 TRINITY_DN6354_c0_g1~~TRINITY_DN6354_c0_g1_i1.p1  ORF type:complete len:297 (+),score=76.13 TRINITY_DN6354_c0_g1_i1:214-1104(+)
MAATAQTSLYSSCGTCTHVNALPDKADLKYRHQIISCKTLSRMTMVDSCRNTLKYSLLQGRGRVGFSSHIKASNVAHALDSDGVAPVSDSQTKSKEDNQQTGLFPDGFESLLMEVCDETNVAELKLKAGSFEMHMLRNIEKSKGSSSVASPLTAPPVPSKPMVESDSSPPTPSAPTPKPSSGSSNPLLTKLQMYKSSKFGLLEAAGDEGLRFVTSPKVGLFKRSRVAKGKVGRPLCEEGQSIKEGQVVCYLDQLGTQTPIMSEVSGEVVKILWDDGEPVGYGDPLIAVLPSFHGIK